MLKSPVNGATKDKTSGNMNHYRIMEPVESVNLICRRTCNINLYAFIHTFKNAQHQNIKDISIEVISVSVLILSFHVPATATALWDGAGYYRRVRKLPVCIAL